MSAHLPTGSQFKQAAAWELIVASVILFVMIVLRVMISKNWRIPSLLSNVMNEDSKMHLALYVLLFVLVFSSALSFFVDA
jgi:hypothetical protein